MYNDLNGRVNHLVKIDRAPDYSVPPNCAPPAKVEKNKRKRKGSKKTKPAKKQKKSAKAVKKKKPEIFQNGKHC